MPLMWMKGLGFRVLNLITNNIFLDKSLNYLLIHVKFIDQTIENHDKRRDRMQKVLKSFVPKVLPQPWMNPKGKRNQCHDESTLCLSNYLCPAISPYMFTLWYSFLKPVEKWKFVWTILTIQRGHLYNQIHRGVYYQNFTKSHEKIYMNFWVTIAWIKWPIRCYI